MGGREGNGGREGPFTIILRFYITTFEQLFTHTHTHTSIYICTLYDFYYLIFYF